MKITIGGNDYTAALDAVRPLSIERRLNEPSVCRLWLVLPRDGSLPVPARYDALAVTGDEGTAYFTGYLAVSPLPEYAGLGLEGLRYRISIQAVSEELLLDQVLMPGGGGMRSACLGSVLARLVTQSGSSALSAQALFGQGGIVNNYSPQRGANWSRQAGEAAAMARSAYRVLNGEVTLSAIPAVIHPLNEEDGSLDPAGLSLTAGSRRALVNDVTVCGGHEPAAYVTEYFLGDGVTSQFNLAEDPYFPAAASTVAIHEFFNEAAINEQVWAAMGSAGSLALGSNGLALNGGNGVDGQTLLSWLDPVEMGGTLLMEAVGVKLAAGSRGMLAGFFLQPAVTENCTAGFQVSADSGTGAVTLQPVVQGVNAGSIFAVDPAHQYTLRVRVHCAECERTRSTYYSAGDSGPISAGGESVLAPARIQMEVQEFVNGVGAMPVTLYDGSIASLPAICTAVAASSLSLRGSMRAFHLTHLGSGWVVSRPVSGGCYTRRLGATSEAAECQLERSGKLVFYTGSIPAAGEQIAVSYRTVGRAVGRAVNANGQQGPAWIGTVTHPPARSSADCRCAAQVLEQAGAGTSALWGGIYKATQQSFAGDVWPGDALLLHAPSAELDVQVVVRSVKLSYAASVPDLVEYEIAFANDWADDLAIRTSATVPVDAWLPAPVAPAPLANLDGLTVTALNGNHVTIDTGVAPPAGGGFEIRLRDNCFLPGEDPLLVARSSAQSITFARASVSDRFYIRMYDGAQPPNYSEFSRALFLNLPVD